MHTELTPNESLKLIESMIGQAKKSFSRISFYFLLWGALMIAAMLSTYLLRNTDPAWSNVSLRGTTPCRIGLLG